MPPPESKIGADDSTASITAGSLENVAVKAPMGPSSGVVAQTITQGNKPLIINTANKRPQIRNHLLAFGDIVESTSAFTIALSILLITSNKQRPAIVSDIEKILMRTFYSAKLELQRVLIQEILMCLFGLSLPA